MLGVLRGKMAQVLRIVPSCEGASPSRLPLLLGASLLAPEKAKDMKGKKAKGISRTAEKQWVTIRVTHEEKLRFINQAELAGLSVSEYIRRNYFGGKPLVAFTDIKLLAELRRIGGLMKHNFETLRLSPASSSRESMEAVFAELQKLINKISFLFNDSQED